jgi:hypothetical protein
LVWFVYLPSIPTGVILEVSEGVNLTSLGTGGSSFLYSSGLEHPETKNQKTPATRKMPPTLIEFILFFIPAPQHRHPLFPLQLEKQPI